VTDERYRVVHLDEIGAVDGWLPIRRHLDIAAFGVNAWRPGEDGRKVIGEHEESSGHEELYLVLEGHATFTVSGEEIDAPPGTLVYVRDPTERRGAVAREPETTILASRHDPLRGDDAR
jgi:hypothetical protein